nr:thioredoxin family protein [uncultured Marinifilum sp.]
MKKISILLLLFAIILNLKAQNNTKEDSKAKSQILYGNITLDTFKKTLCKSWYTPEYKSYQPKNRIVKKLQEKSYRNYRIVLVLGSWCHDSQREVPRFIKILEKIKFPFSKLSINALDTNKHSPDFDTQANNISKVPTIIIYRNEKEIGRIIETPKISLEKDLLKILN